MTFLFDFIAALNELGDTNDFYEGLDGWFGFAIHREAGEYVLTAEYTPWDEEASGPGQSVFERWRLTEMAD